MLQVSLPRQPCFKLNHRFSLKDFAPVTARTSRTGWYHRVLRPGPVRAGDTLRLVDRPWPRWTVERVQEYLHRRPADDAANRLLADVDALGDEARAQFRKRVARALRGATRAAADFRITRRTQETPRIVSLVLDAVRPDPAAELPLLGARARLRLPNGLARTYSVVAGDDASLSKLRNRLELAVALADDSRGGSRHLCRSARVGDVLRVESIAPGPGLCAAASYHRLIAGGIGITALLALVRRMHAVHLDYALHYAVRSAADVPFRDRLAPFRDHMVLYDASRGQRLDVAAIVDALPWNGHLYVCGPPRMMDAARAAVDARGIPPDEVHYEAFAADDDAAAAAAGDAFEAEVAGPAARLLRVAADETLLDALRREVPDFPSSCEVGSCGTCKVRLVHGRVQHRGTALLPEERETAMLACVSRGIGRITIEL